MDLLTIAATALAVSALTFYSGFGLGTLLMPVFALFIPVEAAVAATAVVHAANNLFKLAMVGRHADRSLVLRFGLPAVAGAFAGAAALGMLAPQPPLAEYTLGGRAAAVTPVKLAVSLLMAIFALLELLPRFRNATFDRKHLFAGGLLSGFFGGLSGHQGALRSAFLAKSGVSTRAFVGTNAVIAMMVDAVRLAVYAAVFLAGAEGPLLSAAQWPLIAAGSGAAFAGALLGSRFLHKVTMRAVQALTGALLLALALALGTGIL
jgi:hypothetical protein